jgi:hypothetical protein
MSHSPLWPSRAIVPAIEKNSIDADVRAERWYTRVFAGPGPVKQAQRQSLRFVPFNTV